MLDDLGSSSEEVFDASQLENILMESQATDPKMINLLS